LYETRTRLLLIACVCLLQACAITPSPDLVSTQAIPELNITLPEENCSCLVDEDTADYTFLERGFTALSEDEYIEAVQYFQRYQRLETSKEANWEAAVAIAYVSTLSKSPFYDPSDARNTYRRLRKEFTDDMEVHEKTLLMRDSLETFAVMQRHIDDLRSTNGTLREDLKKREKALKRLRELALGQPVAPQ
jgi:hypothetical protein